VVDQELRAAAEEIGQRGGALVGLEPVRLVHPNPRQRLAVAGHLVAAVGQLLLFLKEGEPGGEPFLAGAGAMGRLCSRGHEWVSLVV